MNIGNSIGGIINGLRITNPQAGQALIWDGTNWSNNTVSTTDGVFTDSSLQGNGLSATPLALVPVNGGGVGTFTYLGGSVDQYGRITTPINCATPLLSVAHDGTLSGNGAAGSPLTVLYAPTGSTGIAHDTTLTGDGTTASPLTVSYAPPGSTGIVHDTTLSGNGETAYPLEVVSAPAGSTAVAVDATLTGNGLTATPLAVASPWAGVIHDATLTGDGKLTNLSALPPASGTVAVAVDATLTGNGLTATPLHAVPPSTGTVGVAVTGPLITGNGLTATPLKVTQTGLGMTAMQSQSIATGAGVNYVLANNLSTFWHNSYGTQLVTTTGIYTATAAGVHTAHHTGTFPANATGVRIVGLEFGVAGYGTFDINTEAGSVSGTAPCSLSISQPALLAIGDTIRWYITQTSGSSLTVSSAMGVTFCGA